MTPSLSPARDALRAGRPVVIPTDTVYGIAVIPAIETAVREVFLLKKRPLDKPMPVLGADLVSLRSVAVFDELAEDLAARFWPGPLTLVLPRAAGFDHYLGADARDVAVRIPDRPLTRELMEVTGPLAVTSANPSGEAPATTPEEARSYFGEDVLVVDDGPAEGVPSTVLQVAGGVRVLRGGALSAAQLGITP